MDTLKLQLEMRLWQRDTETWRTDFTDIDSNIKELEKEIKQIKEKEQEDIKWNKYVVNPKNIKNKQGDDDDYDNDREAEEATQTALSNLGQYDHE